MEIEFNPSQLPVPRASSPVNGAPAPGPAASQNPSLQGLAELQSKLNQLALVRPDKMSAIQPQVSNLQYPPDELLNGIAHLLAMRLSP
jgi:hypothetical protein